MYKDITQEESLEQYKGYKLCYIESIPEEYSDWDEDTKKLFKSEEYKKYQMEEEKKQKENTEKYGFHSYNPVYDNPYWSQMKMINIPNPELKFGKYKAYFTPLDLKEQWGDDWNDAPLEYNAGVPYDVVTDETEEKDGLRFVTKSHEITILTLLFDADCNFPWSYGNNSPFCVEDVNKQAVAWLYDGENTILAGVSPKQFINKIKKFKKYAKEE